MFIKVSPIKGMMQFGKKGKLSPHYVGPFLVLMRVGNIAYELKFPSSLSTIHSAFHVSMLRKCVGDPSLVIPFGRCRHFEFLVVWGRFSGDIRSASPLVTDEGCGFSKGSLEEQKL